MTNSTPVFTRSTERTSTAWLRGPALVLALLTAVSCAVPTPHCTPQSTEGIALLGGSLHADAERLAPKLESTRLKSTRLKPTRRAATTQGAKQSALTRRVGRATAAGGVLTGSTSTRSPGRITLPTMAALLPQDYSPSGMFREAHGDFLAQSERFRPAIQGLFHAMPDGHLQDEPGEFDLLEFAANARVPVIADPDSMLTAGAEFRARNFEFDSQVRGGLQDETLYELGAVVGYSRFFTEDTKIDFELRPGLYTDFDGGAHGDDFKFFGKVLGTFRYRDDLYFKLGIRHNEDFDDAPVLPMAGLSWIINPCWRLDLLLPKRAEITWLPDAATLLSVGLEVGGNEYHVRSTAAFNKRRFDVRTQEVDLYLGWTQRFDDHLSFLARFGMVVAGDYKLRGPTGVAVNGTLDPALLLEVGFGWDF